MKLLKTHQQNLYDAFAKHGFVKDDFSFVKRRGRIFIIHEASKHHLAYLRKKETNLDPDSKQWVHNTSFVLEMSVGPSKQLIPNWEGVLSELDQWLQRINAL